MYTIGVNSAKPIISDVAENSPASVISEQKKFQITAVNGQDVNDWEALNLMLVAQIGESNFD